jgi:hypothetical protein
VSSIEDFSGVDPGELPQLSAMPDDRAKVLWVLWVAKERLNTPMMTPGQISGVLRDAYGYRLSWQKIQAILNGESKTVARRRASKRRAYQIMQAGIEEIAHVSPTVMFVDPVQALSKIREIETILASRTGVVRVCDPYVDGRTLDFLAECRGGSELRLLTVNIKKATVFHRDLKAFRQQHSLLPIEVRVATGGQLHDRYMVDDDSLLLFGTSFNSLGSKQSFVVAVGEDVRKTVLQAFEAMWSSATPV